jgi:hypothetical protein
MAGASSRVGGGSSAAWTVSPGGAAMEVGMDGSAAGHLGWAVPPVLKLARAVPLLLGPTDSSKVSHPD